MTSTTPSARAEAAARVRAEGPISLGEAAPLFGLRSGKGHVSPGTLKRWIAHGKAGVRLDGCKVNGKECTSLAAIARFRKETGV